MPAPSALPIRTQSKCHNPEHRKIGKCINHSGSRFGIVTLKLVWFRSKTILLYK